MGHVRDLWTKPNPDKTSRKKRIKSARWGKGKRWLAVWEEHGKPVSKAFATEDAAEAYVATARVGQDHGTWITKDKRDITLGDLWEPWIESKASRAPKTIASYKSAWAHVAPVFGDTPICELDGPTITTWIDTLHTRRVGQTSSQPLGSGQKRKVGIVINAILKLAVKQSIIYRNPLESGDLVRQEKGRRRALRVGEIDRLLAAAPTEEAELLVRVLLMTAMRPGEAKGLTVDDLDYRRGRLTIRRSVDALGHPGPTKNKLHRDVPVGGDLLLDLEDACVGKNPDDLLLPDEHGHVWTDARWRRVWRHMCEIAGLEGIDTYTLKHTGVTMAIAAGADVYVVQRMCGHADASTTLNVYGHLWDEGLDAIPDAMDAHLAAERDRETRRAARRSQRTARRGGMRAVPEAI
ncbi:tyrosine-type recombinase/integrase [Corynebacterium renale]|uniref:Site-specific recombinase XerD n=1 Tax=Corynebacterium renale TaxID=1724 RepID=A0A2A9DL62_9CORY|nr:site-specific integrase [Corynebacterium renale]PFG27428.1 site-specific recombinase XerD [Corynebacterium renale]SQI23413.1 putative phage integrase [Corynebacterium renale]